MRGEIKHLLVKQNKKKSSEKKHEKKKIKVKANFPAQQQNKKKKNRKKSSKAAICLTIFYIVIDRPVPWLLTFTEKKLQKLKCFFFFAFFFLFYLNKWIVLLRFSAIVCLHSVTNSLFLYLSLCAKETKKKYKNHSIIVWCFIHSYYNMPCRLPC